MNLPTIEPGDLLAYLDGVHLAHVEQALQMSAELREQLETLRRTERSLRKLFGNLPLPDPQDLVDLAVDQATPAQQLLVAAYIRANPAGQQELDTLRLAAAPPKRLRLPRFTALLQAPALGVRSAAAAEQNFYASELAVHVVLRLPPPTDDRWRIEGYVTRNDQPATNVRITLRTAHARPRPRLTDAHGFFTFTRLRAGVYRLRIYFEQGILLLPDISIDYA